VDSALATYGYLLFYLLLVLEGQPIYWAGGFLLSLGVFKLWPLLLGPLFIWLGDYFFYWLGQRYGSDFLLKYGKFIFLTERRVDYIKKHFLNHKGKMIFFTQFIYGIGHNTLLVYGLTKKSYRDIWKYNVIGAILSYTIYLFLGYYLGEGYGYAKQLLKEIAVILLLVVFVSIIGAQVWWRDKDERTDKKLDQTANSDMSSLDKTKN